MCRNIRKHTIRHVRPMKIQIRLRIRAVWSESSLGTFWIARDANFLKADKDDLLSLRWAHMSEGIWCLRLLLIYIFVGASTVEEECMRALLETWIHDVDDYLPCISFISWSCLWFSCVLASDRHWILCFFFRCVCEDICFTVMFHRWVRGLLCGLGICL